MHPEMEFNANEETSINSCNYYIYPGHLDMHLDIYMSAVLCCPGIVGTSCTLGHEYLYIYQDALALSGHHKHLDMDAVLPRYPRIVWTSHALGALPGCPGIA